MDRGRFEAYYGGLSVHEQCRFLVRLAHSLTVNAREAYPAANPGGNNERRLPIFQGVNELMHPLSSQLGALMDDRLERYSNADFCASLFERASAYEVTKQLEWSLSQCAKAAM